MKYRKPYLLRAEVSHADHHTPAQLAELDGVIAVAPGRAGQLPTSIATVLLSAIAPQFAVEQLSSSVSTIRSDDFSAYGDGRTAQVVRCGWLAAIDLLADVPMAAWNWDTIEHDCADHAKRIVYGMFAPDHDGWEDEIAVGGCQPGGPDHECRICGYRW